MLYGQLWTAEKCHGLLAPKLDDGTTVEADLLVGAMPPPLLLLTCGESAQRSANTFDWEVREGSISPLGSCYTSTSELDRIFFIPNHKPNIFFSPQT